MNKTIEILKGCKNVDFNGLCFQENIEEHLPTFTVKDPSPEEWNNKARKANIKAFIDVFGRQPNDYAEVLNWACSVGGENKESHLVAAR